MPINRVTTREIGRTGCYGIEVKQRNWHEITQNQASKEMKLGKSVGQVARDLPQRPRKLIVQVAEAKE